MSKKTFRLVHQTARQRAKAEIDAAPDGYTVTIAEPTRSGDQNSKLWPMLADLSRQVDWYGRKLSPEDWKHLATSSLRKLDVVPNLEGTGFVALGLSTSVMSKREFSALIELLYAIGADKGVVWSEPVDAPA